MKLLDTNVCIDVMKGNAAVVNRIKKHKPSSLCLCTITEFELRQGAERAPKTYQELERSKVALFLSKFDLLSFDSRAAGFAANINAQLLNKGKAISICDVFIAAVALSQGLTLVTNNTRDFSRIDGLIIEDWRK